MLQSKKLLLFSLILIACGGDNDDASDNDMNSGTPIAPDNIVPDIPAFTLGARNIYTHSSEVTNVEFHPSEPIMYVIALDGTVTAFHMETGMTQEVIDLSTLQPVRLLMDFSFHPDFLSNGKVYMGYVRLGSENLVSVVTEFTVNQDPLNFNSVDLSSERELLSWDQTTTDSHNVNEIKFGPDGYLYITSGDGGCCVDSLNNAQNLQSLSGKILRIDINSQNGSTGYEIPGDNPFVGQPDAREEIFAYGLRNPYRLTFDAQGNSFIFDVGNGGREEIDIIPQGDVSGMNFGWTIFEGTRCIGTIEECESLQAMTASPIFEMKHPFSEAIIGGAIYSGDSIPELQGHMIFGDFALGLIWSIIYDPPSDQLTGFYDLTDIVNSDEQVTGLQLVSVNSDREGNVYLVYLSGEVFRLTEER